ncbi:MAG TPA: IS91 family transposase [Solirubrobacteraceae bacterium]|nr:IS91 family transposase [Solirubrobacteraceae bacterium]
MSRPALEVADIFRDHGPAWRLANAGHVSLDQLKVMSAIERCRTAALGGHVAQCDNDECRHTVIAYNSCRNRHCPKCQGAAAREWLAAREAELLPVGYFHVVYTLPAELRDVAYQNKRVIYHLLMKAAAQTTLSIADDPKRLGARIGITAVLHTWGSALTHHPHVHMIVPGGGLSNDSSRWISSRSNFLVHVKVLARLFRGKFLTMLTKAHTQGRLKFFNTHAGLADKRTFKRFLAPLRNTKWVVYCKDPFAGPEQVLRYLSRYTHRLAISNRRLVSADDTGVAFRCKDYRVDGPDRWKTMTLHPHEFIRRLLLHVLPKGFHRIRHYGLFANGDRVANIARARELLGATPRVAEPEEEPAAPDEPRILPCPCPRCGGRMIVIEVFARGREPRHRPTPAPAPIRIDTS